MPGTDTPGEGDEAENRRDGADPPRRVNDRLVLDVMLGKLATYLRMCGYDAAYALDRDLEADDRILALARAEGRTLLTRDRGLAARAEDAVCLSAREIEEQLRELHETGFVLALDDRPSRCGACNGPVAAVGPEEPTPEYAPDPVELDVYRCEECGQHFWKGSHWDDVAARLEGL